MATIYKRNKIYWIGYIRNGARHQFSLETDSLIEAERKKAELEQNLISQRKIKRSINLHEAFKEFLLEKEISQRTKDFYKSIVDMLPDRKVTSFSEEEIKNLYKKLTGSPETKITKITYLRYFFNYLLQKNYIKKNIVLTKHQAKKLESFVLKS